MRRAWAHAWVVWGDTTERQPRTCEWDRAVARYLAFNGRRSGARLAPVVLTSHRRTNTDRQRTRVVCIFFQRPPAYRAIKLASRGGECKSVVYQIDTRSACEPFAFNRRQLLVPSSHRSWPVKSRSSCWSSQELWSAAARSAGGYEGPYDTADSPTHPGPRESVPAQRARAAELACDGRHHLNGESEHLTKLRAAVVRTWPVSVRSVRSCRISGRLSALRIRMAKSLTHLTCVGKFACLR